MLVEELKEKSINETEVLAVVEEEGNTWMTPIYKYLTGGMLPAEKNRVRAIRRKSGRYVVLNEVCRIVHIITPRRFLRLWRISRERKSRENVSRERNRFVYYD